jgi:hypothetical protein
MVWRVGPTEMTRKIRIGLLLVALVSAIELGATPDFSLSVKDPKPAGSPQAIAASDRFFAAQREGVARNPIGLKFTIRLQNGDAQFRQGEVIRIEFSFSSALAKTYQLDGALYDRGGRLEIDSYHVDPEDGAVDPLKNHELGIGGGMRSIPVLDEKPYAIVRELNEYLRFDKPGKYRLYIVANRVQRELTDQERAEAKQRSFITMPATSNIIEFAIAPADAVWAAKQLRSARSVLEARRGRNPMRRDEEIRAACKIVRYLGTEDSIRYMARHLDDHPGDFGYGLMGSPFEARVIREMEAGLAAADCPVSSYYLSVLLSCSYLHRTEPYPGRQDKAKLEAWQREDAKAQAARKALVQEHMMRLADAVLKKEGRAKAVSLNTILNTTVNWPKDWQASMPGGLAAKVPSELAHVFFDLPAQTQDSLLVSHWSWIKGPEMMPVLERYYQNPSREPDSFNPTAAGSALKRIYEMDPKRGRELMLKEISNPTGRVRFEVLSTLSDKILPEMDEVFAAAIENRGKSRFELFALQARLLARYATPAILPRVKAVWLKLDSTRKCDAQAQMLAYFLRVDPAFGAEQLEKGLSAVAQVDSCGNGDLLENTAQLYSCPELEAAAIRHLDDPNPAIALNAVETLGKFGSAAAEAPLWRRFEKWHEEWKGRAAELQTYRIERRPALEMPLTMERTFRSALACARGWLADATKLRQIQALCLTEQERGQVSYMIKEAELPQKSIFFMPGPVDTWTFEVAQYNDLPSLEAVEAKLAQFPKGTVFLWSAFNEGQAEDLKKSTFEELRTFLAGLGMTLETPPQIRTS